jgi:putative N6-adenine-specific DNA methylase
VSLRTAPNRPRPLYASCDTGLEAVLAEELRALGADLVEPGHRGVHFTGNREVLWRVNLCSRIANRVLMPISEFPCHNRDMLYEGVARIDWTSWLTNRHSIAFDASTNRSLMQHTGFMAQVAKDGLCDRMRQDTGQRPDVDRRFPDVPINLRLSEDRCVVSLDSSGARLHRRGYRTEAGEAPLKETLACGILAMTGWTPDQPLADPMCGSGTFVIEAALIAMHMAPGLLRLGKRRPGFTFTNWVDHHAANFEHLVAELQAEIVAEPEVSITGSDTDKKVLEIARRNVNRAGLDGLVTLIHQRLGETRPVVEGTGVLVVNPPYGQRLGVSRELVGLYKQLGDVFKQGFPGWDAWVIASDEAPLKRVGLKAASKTPLRNGSIACKLAHYPLYRGTR